MIDVSRYMLEIKDSRRYLFDKFLSMAQEWSELDWTFNGNLYCDTGDTEYTLMHRDIASREHIKIHAYSDEEMLSIESADIDMVFYENGNLYSITFSLEATDEEMLFELDEVVTEISNHSNMYSEFCDLMYQFPYAPFNPVDCAYKYIKPIIVSGRMKIALAEHQCEDGREYRKYNGECGNVAVHITISDGVDSDDEDDTYYDKDSLILSFENAYRFIYYQEESELIRELVSQKDEASVGIEDFLVRTSLYQCINRNHHLQKIKVQVNIDDGISTVSHTANALFCPECDQHYITETEFSRLKSIGRICCKIITLEEYKKIQSGGYDSWARQSLLRCYGYTVNADDNLSAKERQRILSFVIENNIMSLERVIDFISWLEGRVNSKNLTRARQKWQEDLDYLHRYQPARGVVVAGSFIKKKYHYG